MKKLLTVLLSLFLLIAFTSCDLAEDEATTDDSVLSEADATAAMTDYLFQIDWTDALNWGTFNASLENAEGVEVMAAQGGAEPDAVAGNTSSTNAFFGDSSYNFMHDGTDSYGGVMTSIDGGYDISAATTVVVAINGDTSGLDVIELQLGDAASDQKMNILAYEAITAAETGWVLYEIALTEYDSLNFATFDWAAVWNPKATGFLMTDETGYGAADFLYDIAFK